MVRSASFLSDNEHIVTGGNEKLIRRFAIDRPDSAPPPFPPFLAPPLTPAFPPPVSQEFKGHTEAVRLVSALPDARLFLSAGEDKGLSYAAITCC